jgi:hypothetical protein
MNLYYSNGSILEMKKPSINGGFFIKSIDMGINDSYLFCCAKKWFSANTYFFYDDHLLQTTQQLICPKEQTLVASIVIR